MKILFCCWEQSKYDHSQKDFEPSASEGFLFPNFALMNSFLETPVEYLKGVGPAKADVLKKELQIFTFSDLLSFYPFRYVDRTKFYKIKEIKAELPYVQLRGKIKSKAKFLDTRGIWRLQKTLDRKSTRLNSSHSRASRMPSSA